MIKSLVPLNIKQHVWKPSTKNYNTCWSFCTVLFTVWCLWLLWYFLVLYGIYGYFFSTFWCFVAFLVHVCSCWKLLLLFLAKMYDGSYSIDAFWKCANVVTWMLPNNTKFHKFTHINQHPSFLELIYMDHIIYMYYVVHKETLIWDVFAF